ncbi:MAG: NAD(P)H-dependent oxidoreductase [Mycobacteriales bacterium]
MRTGVVVGNPKPRSRTYQAAVLFATRLAGHEPDLVVDIAGLGAGVLDPDDAAARSAVSAVLGLDVLVVASPTYKATYTGLLKVFLDRFPAGALDALVTVPLMLGAGPGHALAAEVHLKPVLAELGASTPTRALYLLDSAYDDPAALDPWLDAWRGTVLAAATARARVRARAQR